MNLRSFYKYVLFIAFNIIVSCSKEDKSEELIECQKLNFDVALDNQLEFTFQANFPNKERVLYEWRLDGDFQEEDGNTTSGVPDNKFSTTLPPGSHEICIVSKENCVGIKTFCRNITSKVDCEKFNFSRNNKILIADFKGVKSFPEYIWYVDGEEKKTDGTFVKGDNTFDISNLELGTRTICIRSSFCDDTFDYCQDVEITEDDIECTVLTFKREGMLLIPTFPNFTTFESYSWFVDGVEIDKDGVSNNGDNRFDLSSLDDGKFNFCLQSKLCDANVTFCEEVEIVNTPEVSCSTFSFKKEGSFLVPTFQDFVNFKAYSWFVDGVEQDKDGLDNNGDNRFDLYTLDDGKYSICIQSDLCDKSFYFCEDVEVKMEQNCRILFYDQQDNELVANFSGIENERSYNWHVNGKVFKKDGRINNGNNRLNLDNLESGIYKICIISEGCDPEFNFCRNSVQVGDQNNIACPDLNYTRNGDKLVANFTGMDTHSLYKWVVDSNTVKDDGVSVDGNNTLDISGYEPGTYKICIFSPGCSVGNYYCDQITIN